MWGKFSNQISHEGLAAEERGLPLPAALSLALFLSLSLVADNPECAVWITAASPGINQRLIMHVKLITYSKGTKSPEYLPAGRALCMCIYSHACVCVYQLWSSILKQALLMAFFIPHLTFLFHPSSCALKRF